MHIIVVAAPALRAAHLGFVAAAVVAAAVLSTTAPASSPRDRSVAGRPGQVGQVAPLPGPAPACLVLLRPRCPNFRSQPQAPIAGFRCLAAADWLELESEPAQAR